MVSNKSRLLRLYRYLYINTDEDHYTTKAEIMDALRDEETIYSRQTVRDDIDTLSREGYDIETVVSSGNYYYFRDREFSLEELRLMIDAVTASRFIDRKRKAEIIDKLGGFCSKYQAQAIRRNVVCVETPRSNDAQTYASVNTINDAINQGKRIGFGYSGAHTDRSGPEDAGASFTCSPFDIVWDGRDFYLAALPDGEEKACLFKVERMIAPVILEDRAVLKPADFDTAGFAQEKLS